MVRKVYVNFSCTCGGQPAKLSVSAGGHYSPQHDGGIHIETTTTRVACDGSIMEPVVYNILRTSGCERKTGLRSKDTTKKFSEENRGLIYM